MLQLDPSPNPLVLNHLLASGRFSCVKYSNSLRLQWGNAQKNPIEYSGIYFRVNMQKLANVFFVLIWDTFKFNFSILTTTYSKIK